MTGHEEKTALLARLLDKHRNLVDDHLQLNRLRHLYRDSPFPILKKATNLFLSRPVATAGSISDWIEKESYRLTLDRKKPLTDSEKHYYKRMEAAGFQKHIVKKMPTGSAYIWTHWKSEYPEYHPSQKKLTKHDIMEQIFELRAKFPKVFLKIKEGTELEAFGIEKGYLNAS